MLNLLLAVLLSFSQDQEPQFPPIQGAINDFANIMSEEDKVKLRNKCAALRDSGGAAVVVCTTPSLYGLNVEDYANQLFKKWGIGKKKEDNGVLILIAPNEKKARIEVGYGNEGKLTDLEAKAILTNVVRPLFRAGKVSESVVAGTEAVLAKLGGAGPPTPILNKEPIPTGLNGWDWVLLGMSPILWIPLGIALAIFIIWLLAKMDVGSSGYSSYGGGGWSGGGGSSWGGGGSSSSDSSSSSESSSSGGGDTGGGGASSDL